MIGSRSEALVVFRNGKNEGNRRKARMYMPEEIDRVMNMAVSDPNERRWVKKIRGTSVRVLR